VIIEGIGKTDTGMVRRSNQDSYYINNQHSFYIVADGMGGHAGGEVASKMCVDEFKESLETSDIKLNYDADFHIFLERTLNKACTRIYEKSLEHPDLKGMGTTASCAFIRDNRIHCGHVGDSRIYLIRAGFIYQLSVDHSLVSEQLKAGVITEEMATNHQLKNVITRSIGYQEEEFVDTFSQEVEWGDIILLCSDGLHGKISDQEIVNLCSSDIKTSPERLIQLANDRGGEDNISVIVVTVEK
jgi:protein phosphatase